MVLELFDNMIFEAISSIVTMRYATSAVQEVQKVHELRTKATDLNEVICIRILEYVSEIKISAGGKDFSFPGF